MAPQKQTGGSSGEAHCPVTGCERVFQLRRSLQQHLLLDHDKDQMVTVLAKRAFAFSDAPRYDFCGTIHSKGGSSIKSPGMASISSVPSCSSSSFESDFSGRVSISSISSFGAAKSESEGECKYESRSEDKMDVEEDEGHPPVSSLTPEAEKQQQDHELRAGQEHKPNSHPEIEIKIEIDVKVTAEVNSQNTAHPPIHPPTTTTPTNTQEEEEEEEEEQNKQQQQTPPTPPQAQQPNRAQTNNVNRAELRMHNATVKKCATKCRTLAGHATAADLRRHHPLCAAGLRRDCRCEAAGCGVWFARSHELVRHRMKHHARLVEADARRLLGVYKVQERVRVQEEGMEGDWEGEEEEGQARARGQGQVQGQAQAQAQAQVAEGEGTETKTGGDVVMMVESREDSIVVD
ncbi:hypothetical protein VTK56DRAFT_8811 [Thermocarpiscus australiensis]